MTAIIVPKYETDGVRKGRSMMSRLQGEIRSMRVAGKQPTRIVISRHAADLMREWLDFATVDFDGALPATMFGAKLQIEPGASFQIAVDYQAKE